MSVMTSMIGGSSPHVRGALTNEVWKPLVDGIIPACAGSTTAWSTCSMLTGDHPRMCGEHKVFSPVLNGVKGSSPHVRGALERVVDGAHGVGIIPACAGSTVVRCGHINIRRDHPRMCGEHLVRFRTCAPSAGSSPHVRGALVGSLRVRQLLGIIPACAGSTVTVCHAEDRNRDHPRMCGEHRTPSRPLTGLSGSSPHVRGARCHGVVRSLSPGIIPACAGST